MLNIELDQTAECCNPVCRAEIAPPDDQHRFCQECGAAQVFECEACTTRPGALLRVAEDPVCPRCGAVYVLCGACRFPLRVTDTGALTCPEGCHGGLTEARGGWCADLAGVARTGAVTIRPQATEVGTPQVWALEEPISHPVCRFGRLYALTARGVVRCLDEDTGRDAPQWRTVPVAPAGSGALEEASLAVSERFLTVGCGGELMACSVSDGEVAFRLQTSLQGLRWALLDDRLLICGLSGPGAMRVELRNTSALCRGESGLIQAWDIEGRKSRTVVEWPAAARGVFAFTDLDGSLRKVSSTGGKEFAPLWQNQGYTYSSAPVLVQGQALVIVHSPNRGAALVRAPLDGGRVQESRLEGLTPAYLGPRVSGRHLYLFDNDERGSFRQYDLVTPTGPSCPIFMGVRMSVDQALVEVLVLEDPRGRGAWIVTLSGTAGALTPRMVHTESQTRPDVGDGRVGALALAASDRRLFICDLQSGEVLVHHIPAA